MTTLELVNSAVVSHNSAGRARCAIYYMCTLSNKAVRDSAMLVGGLTMLVA